MSNSALSFLPVFIIPVALLSVGGMSIVEGILSFLKHRRLAQLGTYTSGTVAEVVRRRRDAFGWILTLRVQFKTQMGQDVDFKEGVCTKEMYASGHWVPVTYDPHDPRKATIGHPETLTGWRRNMPDIRGVMMFAAGLWLFIEFVKLIRAL